DAVAEIASGKKTRHEPLDGHYRLPIASAAAVLDYNTGGSRGYPLGFSFNVFVAEEPETLARLTADFLDPPKRYDVRVLREEVERHEAENARDKGSPVLMRDNQRHRERSRAIAQLLWERERALTIEHMIDRSEITRIGQEGTPYE